MHASCISTQAPICVRRSLPRNPNFNFLFPFPSLCLLYIICLCFITFFLMLSRLYFSTYMFVCLQYAILGFLLFSYFNTMNMHSHAQLLMPKVLRCSKVSEVSHALV